MGKACVTQAGLLFRGTIRCEVRNKGIRSRFGLFNFMIDDSGLLRDRRSCSAADGERTDLMRRCAGTTLRLPENDTETFAPQRIAWQAEFIVNHLQQTPKLGDDMTCALALVHSRSARGGQI